MTREDLLELAALDVYGLLDEYEAALYTRSFHHAPVTVQKEIVELQAEIASNEPLLPDLAPPPALRRKVLASVARAVEQENEKLEPIASIGYRRTPGATRPQRTVAARLFSGSNHFWRAACFALCGAVVVLVFFWYDAKQQAANITRIAIDQQTLLIMKELGIESAFADPAMTTCWLAPRDASLPEDAWARVWIAGEGDSFLTFNGLAARESMYRVTVTDADGVTHEVAQFQGQDRLGGVVVHLAAVQLASTSVWTVSTAEGVVFRSVPA